MMKDGLRQTVLFQLFFKRGLLMKIIAFLICLYTVVPSAFCATMGFKTSDPYIVKGDEVTFTLTYVADVDPGNGALLPDRVNVRIKLRNQDDDLFSKEFTLDSGETIEHTYTMAFEQPGYYDIDAFFTMTTTDDEGEETKDTKRLETSVGVANWVFSADNTLGCVESTPAVSPDKTTLYVGSEDRFLYAINLNDGTEKWRFLANERIRSTPALDNHGNIYFGSAAGTLYCLDREGFPVWQYDTQSAIFSSPAIDLDLQRIYIGCNDTYLYALDLSGKFAWKFKTGAKITSSPVIGFDNTVYIGSLDHFLYAITPQDDQGVLKWKFDANSEIVGSPAIDKDGTLFLGTASFGGGVDTRNGLFAISTTGEQKWFVQHNHGFVSAPVIGNDGTLCIGSFSNTLYGINRNGDGLSMYREFSDDHAASPALGSNNYIFCGSKDGMFYGLDLLKGDTYGGRVVRWNYQLEQPITTSSPVISDGFVFVGTCDYNNGKVYSLFCDKKIENSEVSADEESPWPQFRNGPQNTGKTGYTAETTAPEIVSVDPAINETQLDVNRRSISASFSRPMDPESLYTPKTTIKEAYYGFTLGPFDLGPEHFEITWNETHTVCTLNLPVEESFKPYVKYTASILSKASAADMPENSGNDAILYTYSWSFSATDEQEVSYSHSPGSPCFVSNILQQ
jgi:outer membrane protein assembly factor BamB